MDTPRDRLTHGDPEKNGGHFADDIFKCIFLNENYCILIQIWLKLFLWLNLKISQHWFRWWLGTEQVTNHYLSQWWPSSLLPYCVTMPEGDKYPVTRPVVGSHKVMHDDVIKWKHFPRYAPVTSHSRASTGPKPQTLTSESAIVDWSQICHKDHHYLLQFVDFGHCWPVIRLHGDDLLEVS